MSMGSRIFDSLKLVKMQSYLDSDEQKRVQKVQEQWNFYEGYHWEDIPNDGDRPQVTENYCATYVNKFVSFELGKGFSINTQKDLKEAVITDGGLTIVEYLNRVWQDNRRDQLLYEIGQAKAVNGDMWVQVKFESPDEIDDPFEEYSRGRVRIIAYHKGLVFTTYDPHDKDKLIELKLMYEIELKSSGLFGTTSTETVVYKQIWTKNKIVEYHGNQIISEQDNPYGIIPFVQIKNFPLVGRNEGISDLENLIPLNVEYNLKKSDISEIIDYHASPVTVVYGAKIGNLERGANKVWGGLPKDAKVENLELSSDLKASNQYCDNLKKSMNEVGGIPVGALGGEQAISNTSGVALQFVNAPIIERTNIKKEATSYGIRQINKLILYLSVLNGIVRIPDGVTKSDFYNTIVEIPDTTPKDSLVELQQIEIEMRLGLECRKGAMHRLGREDIDNTIEEIDKDREEHPELYGIQTTEPETDDIDGTDDTSDDSDTKEVGMGGTKRRPTDDNGMNKEGEPKKINSGMTNQSPPVREK